jgi:hypothetical protein
MGIVLDADVQRVVEFMEAGFPASMLVAIATASTVLPRSCGAIIFAR